MVPSCGDVHVSGLAFVHYLGIGDRSAALPFLDDARIARARQRAVAEVGEDVHGVPVDPLQRALGFVAEETAVDPALGVQIELTGHIGVRTAARQRDQAAAVIGAQAVGAVPDPVLALGLVQRVEVDQDLPLRPGLAVLLQRRAPPQPAGVLLVAPEVVVPLALLVDAGDLVIGIVDGEQVGLELLELRRARLFGLVLRVLLPDPLQRLGILHAFQPLVGIGHLRLLVRVHGAGRKAHRQREGRHRNEIRHHWFHLEMMANATTDRARPAVSKVGRGVRRQ